MSQPRVSVVIPAHNAAPFIGDALRSVCQQTYPPDRLEIVVVDDGSTDGTAATARVAVDRHRRSIVVLQTPQALGPSAARNRGWQAASGEWIQFLDADDVISESKIDVQARAAATLPADVACVYSRWARVTRLGAPVEPSDTFDPDLNGDPIAAVLRPENFLPFASQLVRRSWLKAVDGFDERCWLVEDVDLQIRLLLAGGGIRRVASAAPLFWYRRREGSLSRRNERAFVHACVRNVDLLSARIREEGASGAARRQALVDAYYWAARFFAEHDSAAFDATIAKIRLLDPSFVPPAPVPLRQLSRLLGYANAERIAVRYRQLKRLTKGGRA
jgi:glycosyltransferase involved in cell wall biosynthesis